MTFRVITALGLLIGTSIAAPVAARETDPSLPATAAMMFIATLSPAERIALQPFSSSDRQAVRLTPGRRGGLALKDMDKGTRAATWGLLRALLSPRGIRMVQLVLDRERRLAVIEKAPKYRDPEKYYLAIFGRPGEDRWAVRFEGHHLSINVTLQVDRTVAVLPFLIGVNPRRGPADDILMPFVRTSLTPTRFRRALQSLFRPDAAIPTVADMRIRPYNIDGIGHPHLTVTKR